MATIALLTDFGLRDGYVAVMKGTIKNISAGASIIDISHEIGPQQIAEGRFVLWTAYRYFPADTIFVCVVDPGVGTERKILAVKTAEFIFLAPDNSLLDLVLAESAIEEAYHVTNRKYFLTKISQTFHGRDIFSPVAAHLANGLKLASLGPVCSLEKPDSPLVDVTGKGEYMGKVIGIDRFGNLITNLRMEKIMKGHVKIMDTTVLLQNTYASVEKGELLALIESNCLIEIAVRDGDARHLLLADYATPVQLKVK